MTVIVIGNDEISTKIGCVHQIDPKRHDGQMSSGARSVVMRPGPPGKRCCTSSREAPPAPSDRTSDEQGVGSASATTAGRAGDPRTRRVRFDSGNGFVCDDVCSPSSQNARNKVA